MKILRKGPRKGKIIAPAADVVATDITKRIMNGKNDEEATMTATMTATVTATEAATEMTIAVQMKETDEETEKGDEKKRRNDPIVTGNVTLTGPT